MSRMEFSKLKRNFKQSTDSIINNRYTAFLAVLVVTGFLIRVYFSLELSLWHDETVTANSVISFLENGVPDYSSGFEYWRSVTSWIIPAGLASILGSSEIVLRFPSIIYSTFVIPLVYWIGKEWYSNEAGLVAASFTAFSAWQLSYATQIRMYALFQLLYFLTFYSIYRTGENATGKNMMLTLFLTFYSMTVHVTAYIIPVTGFVYLMYRWGFYKRISNFDFKYLLIGFGFLISGFVLNEYYFTYIGLLERLVFRPENLKFYINFMLEGYPALWILGVIGLILTWKKGKILALNILAIVPPLYIYLIHVEHFGARYLFYSMPFLSIMVGTTIDKLSKALKHKLDIKHDIYCFIIPLTALTLALGGSFDYGFEDSNTRPVYDQKSAYSYVESNEIDGDFLVTQWTPPAIYYHKEPDAVIYPDYISRDDRFHNDTEKYSGAKNIIRDSSDLESYIEDNPRGWIVLRENSFRSLDKDIKQVLSELGKTEFEGVTVWRWE